MSSQHFAASTALPRIERFANTVLRALIVTKRESPKSKGFSKYEMQHVNPQKNEADTERSS